LTPHVPTDTFFARGFGGRLITIIPSRDAVIVMSNLACVEDTEAIAKLVGDVLKALP